MSWMQTSLELLVQVTLWTTVGLLLLHLMLRHRLERMATVATLFVLGIVVLTAIAWVPWPGWLPATPSSFANDSTGVMTTTEPAGSGEPVLSIAWKAWRSWVPTMPVMHGTEQQPAFSWSFWLLALFLAGMIIGSVRFLFALYAVHRERRRCRDIDHESLNTIMLELAAQLHLARPVHLLESPTLRVPATTGWWRPSILLPRDWPTWSDAECKAVLAHELAHIRRADYLLMMLTQLVGIVYWFHPLVGWLSRSLRAGQELAADALAVHALGDRHTYLQCLARLALVQDGTRLPAPARLFLSPEVSLLRRIAMLREGSRGNAGRLVRYSLMGMVLAFGLLVASLRGSVLAEEKFSVSLDEGWQRYIDPQGPGFLVLRPKACLELDSMKVHGDFLNEVMKDRYKFGVSLDEVESFMGTLVVSPRVNNEVGTGHADYHGTYFRFTTAAATDKFLNCYLEGYEAAERPVGKCFRSTGKSKFNNVEYFLRPDDRTLVFPQSMAELDRWLTTQSKPTSKPAWLKEWPATSEMAFVALNVRCEPVQTAIKQGAADSPVFPMIKPILPDLLSVTSAVSTEDQPTVVSRLYCTTGEAASKSLKQASALITMAKLIRVTGTTGSTPEKEDAEHASLVKLLNSLKTRCVGEEVVIELRSPATVGDLLVMSQMRDGMEQGKIKTVESNKK